MKVPFLDLKAQYSFIEDEVSDAIARVMESCAFAGGPFVEQFERDFALFCGCELAVGVGSGTEALWVSLLALGIGPGDEVITVPNTFIATAEAITFCGARPVFVDVDEKTYTMRPDLLAAAMTPKTKAIIPVHLYGQMADMDPIMEIAGVHGLAVIEDACQAHGAEYKGRPAGSIGNAGCFSFYPGKNLGAYGEAGAVVTNRPELAKTIRALRDHGQTSKYYHHAVGWNARMDGLQGAVLSVKLRHLSDWNEARVKIARAYNELLGKMPEVITPVVAEYAKHVFHIYAIRVQDRDDMIKALSKKDIHCGIHYPVPIHLQKAYGFLRFEAGSLPISEQCAGELVSLPMFPELDDEQIKFVCEQIGALTGIDTAAPVK